MAGDIFGRALRLISFGESHGKVVGAVLEGVPAGLPLSEEDVQWLLDLRKPGQSSVTTTRREEDRVKIVSGVFKGKTTGAPITMVVENRDVISSYYEEYFYRPRPGHADYVARLKYGGFNDYRGGGRFSGRITVSMVMGGAVAMKLLRLIGVEVMAYTLEIGGVRAENFTLEDVKARYSNEVRTPDSKAALKMKEVIERARREGDSVGGIVEVLALNLPPGLGEPVFDTIEGDLAKAMFAIPAVKGVEFGSGFKAARMRGSEHNDPYVVRDGKVSFASNNHGGALGGMTTGAPLIMRVAFKPTASIAKPQRTVDLRTMEEVTIRVKGRHDPCIVPRAVPVVEAMTSLVLADHAILSGYIPRVLEGAFDGDEGEDKGSHPKDL